MEEVTPRKVTVHRANDADPVTIEIGKSLMEDGQGDISLNLLNIAYTAEADALADALFDSLPMGVTHRVMMRMMFRYISKYDASNTQRKA